MQQGLPLALAATQVAERAVLSYLSDVTLHGLPAGDLAPVFVGHPPAQVVAAVPLEPASRVVRMYPSASLPLGERQ